MTYRKVLAVLLLLLLVVFVVMNLDTARVWCFGVKSEMPIAVLVLLSGLLGFGAGLLLAYVRKQPKKGSTTTP